MEHNFSLVDIDGSRTLDFYEYMFLSFLMTQSGSYVEFVQASANAPLVKACLVELNANYRCVHAVFEMRVDGFYTYITCVLTTNIPLCMCVSCD